MKKHLSNVIFTAFLALPFRGLAQEPAEKPITAGREKMGIVAIDVRGLPSTDAITVGNIVRTNVDKIGQYEVIDRYDMEYQLKNSSFDLTNCFGKQCVVDLGKRIKADKMMTGSIEIIGERLAITLKLVDVAKSEVERTQVMEFLNLRTQLPQMLEITTNKLFKQPIDEQLATRLTKKDNYESTINTPEAAQLNLNGPRVGITIFSGQTATIFKDKKTNGGFDINPVMFQFGYQFEKTYLNQGNFQALFEFIPLITGLDQNQFLPSISILNGLRSNVGGWEFAFGPIFYASKKAEGHYDQDGKWTLGSSNIFPTETRLDSRGTPTFSTSFVFAFGKSFKSGTMNIPINAFVIPDKRSFRIGLSMGFNAKR